MFTKAHFTIFFVILLCYFNYVGTKRAKSQKKYNEIQSSSKYNNPNFIRDRHHDEIWKPLMPEKWVNRFKKPYHPAWMDYCDPYHCNDYHKVACGLNRRTMRYKWFQSECHIILNNMCAQYRGALKYDVVDTKYCSRYVMFLRIGCPTLCPNKLDAICGIDSKNQVAMFKNKCFLERANCRAYPEEIREVDMEICESLLYTLPVLT